MKENKQDICTLLCEALRATRDQEDLIAITYDKNTIGDETATLTYLNGYKRSVNVTLDSGIAMIRDILKNL